MTLDPEQRAALDVMYAHDARGRLTATEFGGCAPRQNWKTHVAKAAALADLVLFDEPDSLWSAHLRDTSDRSFRELVELFENYDHLRRLLDGRPKDSDGEQVIRLRRPHAGAHQPELRFMARSERGGRGLSGRRVTFDEALFLKPSMLSAMIPILSAQSISGNVQARYLGSAGRLQSAVWREIRDRGRRGDQRRMAWLECAAPHEPCDEAGCSHAVGTGGCALDRPHLIRAANFAVDRRIDLEFVLTTERQAMQPPSEFACERLGWWQDPPNVEGGDLDVQAWLALADVEEQPRPPLVFGVDVAEDRLVSIGVAWRRADERVQVMVGVDGDGRLDVGLSPRAAVARLVELAGRWQGLVVLGGPAVDLEAELLAAGVRCEVTSAGEFAAASGRVADLLAERGLAHGDQEELNRAVSVARWRSAGTSGERAFQLRGAPDVGPLAAATRAVHGLSTASTGGGWMVSVP
jgi:hypothetical protein